MAAPMGVTALPEERCGPDPEGCPASHAKTGGGVSAIVQEANDKMSSCHRRLCAPLLLTCNLPLHPVWISSQGSHRGIHLPRCTWPTRAGCAKRIAASQAAEQQR